MDFNFMHILANKDLMEFTLYKGSNKASKPCGYEYINNYACTSLPRSEVVIWTKEHTSHEV